MDLAMGRPALMGAVEMMESGLAPTDDAGIAVLRGYYGITVTLHLIPAAPPRGVTVTVHLILAAS
jgi:hypothetical protein